MHVSPLLGPVVALVAWSLVMFIWMAVEATAAVMRRRTSRRAPAAPISRRRYPGKRSTGRRTITMHLMEQPTIFYAIVFALVLMGFDARINVYLAWGYVGLAHRPQHRPGDGEHRAARASRCSCWRRSAWSASPLHAAIFLIHHG